MRRNRIQKTRRKNIFWYIEVTIKGLYKESKLSPDRIKRLEEIGFKW
jgi:hypothetical protein